MRWLWLKKKKEPNRPWLAFSIQVHQCAWCLLFCGCDFRSWWCCSHIILDWLLASWATDLWSGAPAIYFCCLQKVKQAHGIGKWFLSQLDCKYPRFSICWCYYQIPWALGHSLWGGFAAWVRRHICCFSISGQHTAKSAYRSLFQGAVTYGPWERIWKSWAPGNCNSLCG